MISLSSLPPEEERLLVEGHVPLIGKVVIQGLVFTWTCESGAMLKVQHPQYGLRLVHLDRHYEPRTLANLVALGMVGNGPTPQRDHVGA